MTNEILIIHIALAAVLFAFGALFYNLSRNSEMRVYKTALQVMAFAYCFSGMVNVLDIYSRSLSGTDDDVLILQIATLIVAVSQVFLFSYTLIFLIHSAYVTRKRLLREFIPILAMSAALIAAFLILPAARVKIAVYLFILFYVWLLIKYSRLFIITYRECRRKLDNFFSGPEAEYLRWINFSFYAALSIALLALTASLFPDIRFDAVCSAIYLVFYLYFAYRIINYGFVFKKMKNALSNDVQVEQSKETSNTQQTLTGKNIERNLERWIEEKRFLQSGIVIDELANQIGTNRSYLSEYINSTREKIFRQWINELRIDYAKSLLDENPELELWRIAEQTGYADKSYFSKCFKKITGKTPTEYREKK